MKKIILILVIVLGFGGAYFYRTNRITASRFILTDGNLYSISNTLGEKNYATLTANKDIKIMFDQKNGKIIYGKSWEEETVDSESIGGTKIWIMDLDGRNEKQLSEELCIRAFFDRKEDKVYYVTRDLDLHSVNFNGGNKLKIMEKVVNPDQSPDGRLLVYQKANSDWQLGNYLDRALGIAVLDLITGEEKQITNVMEDFNPFWTPDGKKILFFSRSNEGLASHFIMNNDGSGRKQLTNIGEKFVNDRVVPMPSEKPIWSSDGKYLVYESDREIWYNKFDSNFNLIDAKQLAYGRDPAWVIDGKRISIVVNNTNKINEALIEVDLDGSINN